MYERFAYLKNLKRRKSDESLRSNIVFGQTIGWTLSILSAFRYFVCQENNWWYGLMLGNAFLLLGLGAPRALERPQYYLETIASFVSERLQTVILTLLYFVIVCPCGWLMQHFFWKVPFYYWLDEFDGPIEGWIPKHIPDSSNLIVGKNKLANLYLFQFLNYLSKSRQLLILPSLVLILLISLVAIFIQSTPIAPMIYTLF
ncbi:MAG: hypothetical protein K2X81_02715 [Candidatus Obscuribacterales bacterium]|nr:hypothetical protein [Candidatus Obscuribacterales bacterium]